MLMCRKNMRNLPANDLPANVQNTGILQEYFLYFLKFFFSFFSPEIYNTIVSALTKKQKNKKKKTGQNQILPIIPTNF